MPRDLLRSFKEVSCNGQSGINVTAFDMRLMPQSQFGTDLPCAFFVTEKDDFDITREKGPALQSIALDDAIVSLKRLRCGKNGEHSSRFRYLAYHHTESQPVTSWLPTSGPREYRTKVQSPGTFLFKCVNNDWGFQFCLLFFGDNSVSKYATWGKYARFFCVLFLIPFAAGCGGGGGRKIPPPPAPAVTIAPSPVTFPAISQGAVGTPTTIVVTNSGTGALNITSVVVGGTNSKDFSTTNSCSGSIASMGTCNIVVNFTPSDSGALSETITITDNAATSPQVINVSGTANPIVLSLTPLASAMGVSQTISFVATGDPNGVTWSVIGAPFLGSPSVVTSPGMIDANGNYTGPGGASSFYATVTATSKTAPTISASATVNVVAPGTFIQAPLNVQVAQYAVTPPSPATVSVQFGLTTTYGLNTWTQPNTTLGSPVSLYVAGMTQSTPYHMRGVLQFGDGSSFDDSDFTFTTGALPAGTVPNITATTTAGMTPQPGVEVLDTFNLSVSPILQVLVTDLNANVLWAYAPGNAIPAGAGPQPVKLLPNGHFLMNFASSNSAGEATNSVLQEVDLGGNLIWQMTVAQLNTALAAAPASCTECNVSVLGTHHDVAILPNGHLIVLADTTQVVSGTTVTGDVVIDLGDMENVGGNNPNHLAQPTWAWNEFNHFDINRRPYSYPDWTHTNAVIYSKDDNNLIISSRHQNWLVKIDYNNGAGAGDILWKMGAVLPTDTTPEDTADFALLNADGTPDTNATDWFFAQHAPSFTTANTTGKFGLTLFDNGDDRGAAVVAGGTCGVAGQPACFSTVPVFTIDETAMTATFVIHPTTNGYSFFGGNAEVLANGNVEYDECSDGNRPGENGSTFEVTASSTPQIVWEMQNTGQYVYRAMRIGSLYPGVQW
jgi:arylsulfate sulfotransferase